MSEEKSVEAYKRSVRARVQGPIAVVPLTRGGFAFMRRPTTAEYETLQAGVDEPGAKQIMFAGYIRSCFVGACDGAGEELTFEALETLEGPAFVRGGALGHAVNKLAGQEARPMQFL